MPKRFVSTEIWNEDWYLEMPTEYKLFWFYMLGACNHAGLFKVNLRTFSGLNDLKVTSNDAITFFNSGKNRIRVITNTLWLIEDFFAFQYGSTFNGNNRLHQSIENEYKKVGIELTSIRGLKDLKEGVKDKVIVDNKGSIGTREDRAAEKEEKMKWFVLFYDAYKKKVGKEDAKKAWLKIDLRLMPEIVEAAKRCAAKVIDKQFQKDPASWLNAKRWEDEELLAVGGNGNGHPTMEQIKSNANLFV
jgi:hypothetical protein